MVIGLCSILIIRVPSMYISIEYSFDEIIYKLSLRSDTSERVYNVYNIEDRTLNLAVDRHERTAEYARRRGRVRTTIVHEVHREK